jgi:hypothetical protein
MVRLSFLPSLRQYICCVSVDLFSHHFATIVCHLNTNDKIFIMWTCNNDGKGFYFLTTIPQWHTLLLMKYFVNVQNQPYHITTKSDIDKYLHQENNFPSSLVYHIQHAIMADYLLWQHGMLGVTH